MIRRAGLRTVLAPLYVLLTVSCSTAILRTDSERGFTGWMTDLDYQALFTSKANEGFYPVKVEAKVTAEGLVYRGQFEPVPGAPFAFYAHHGIPEDVFRTRARELASGGYRAIWVQRVFDRFGAAWYQVTWIKGNGPRGIPVPGPEPEQRPVAAAPASSPSSVPVAVRPPAALPWREPGGSIYSDSWAIVIGINEYQHRRVPKLRYAVNDARAMEQALLAQGFRRDRIMTLIDAEATKARIETVLGDELRQNVGPNDRVLVFFAGHGMTDRLASGEEEGYLTPVDGDPSRLFGTAISMTAIRHISDRLPAKHILYIVDACYSGYAFFNRSVASDLLGEMARRPAIQILTAGRQNDEAQEREGHGVFTQVLLRGLANDAFSGKDWLALEELGLWVKERVFAESNRKQLPQYGNLSGEGQFIFFRPARAPTPGAGARP